MDVFSYVLTYKEESFEHLIDIGLRMGCDYMLEYWGLIEWFICGYIVLHPLFYNYLNNINFYYNYAFSWHIKLVRDKVWSGTKRKYFERWHEAKLQKNVYCLWNTQCYGTPIDLHNHIYYSINVDILITFYIYVYRLNMKRREKIKLMNKTFQITKVQYPLQMIKKWRANNFCNDKN